MNYLSSGEYDADFYGDSLLYGSHWNGESNASIDEFGNFPETTSEFFSFSSEDVSDPDKPGELDAA